MTIKWSNKHKSCELESIYTHIEAGVPQGSVLGNLLFILFIDDLPCHIDFCDLDLYADDATISPSNSSLSTLANFMTAGL